MTYMDDHSWKYWVFLLHTKDEAFKKFKNFWRLVETKSGSLKSDKSGEYVYGYIEEYANCTKFNVKLP
jgi:hypothetical protein